VGLNRANPFLGLSGKKNLKKKKGISALEKGGKEWVGGGKKSQQVRKGFDSLDWAGKTQGDNGRKGVSQNRQSSGPVLCKKPHLSKRKEWRLLPKGRRGIGGERDRESWHDLKKVEDTGGGRTHVLDNERGSSRN